MASRINFTKRAIMVHGNDQLAFSVTVCLLLAGHPVTLVTEYSEEAKNKIDKHFTAWSEIKYPPKRKELKIVKSSGADTDFGLAIAITSENLQEKYKVIESFESILPSDCIIAINTESIPLCSLQNDSAHPCRIIGINWVEPAHTTFFLEIITNSLNNESDVISLFEHAKTFWAKDPYLINTGLGIRAKLFSVMAREAFYLVENGYASVEDIDRACRNDAGYYLPFAGNFQYMDLMGTYAYGLVMKDLNRELSKESDLPSFFTAILNQGGSGMQNLKGFYSYGEDEVKQWNELFAKFSYEIHDIINKYPFNHGTKDKTSLIK